MQMHPDFDEIRDSDEFHEWAEEQPKWVQDALYENDNDARSAARAIDLYKADMGIGKKKPKSDKDAAKSVSTKNSRSKPQENEASSRKSQMFSACLRKSMRQVDEIMEAIRSGKFVYDVSWFCTMSIIFKPEKDMELFAPFGPTMGYYRMPEELVEN